MSHPAVAPPQAPSIDPLMIEETVRKRLTEGGPYRFHFHRVSFEYSDGTLVLRGKLPTFYLKQILQTLLRDIEGISQIDNRVDVVSSTGLSSVRNTK